MKRLTKRREDGTVMLAWECPEECEYSTCSMEEGITCGHECEAEVWCKLAQYEDLAEQGRLIELPCKIGDKVYSVEGESEYGIYEYTFDGIESDGYRLFYKNHKSDVLVFETDSFGSELFLTREDAERKIEELESEGK